MRRLAAVFALLALFAQDAHAAAAGRFVTVALPRAARGEAIVLRVRCGVLRRGMEIDVYDARGSLLGTVSPFAIRGHRAAGTYPIPLSGDLARRIRVRLVLRSYGSPPRAPTLLEVRGVTAGLSR